MKKFKPMKVKNSTVTLPEEFLDSLLINDGDLLQIFEDENGRYYIRKTYGSPDASKSSKSNFSSENTTPPPPSMDEMMRKAQKAMSDMPVGEDFMKTIEGTLNNPEMMKKIEEMAQGFMKGFMKQTQDNSDFEESEDDEYDEEDDEYDEEDDDEDDNGESFKVDID